MKNNELISYHQKKGGELHCTLNLLKLYPACEERKKFLNRLCPFLKSDPDQDEIYQLEGNLLTFYSEQLIPIKVDERPTLLMVFGNPAPQSIKQGMFFASQRNSKEHRFWWHILRYSGLVDLTFCNDLPVKERSKQRKKRLLELDYNSPFRIGLCVYISMPSGASTKKWGGVAGVHKLLGKKVMGQLSACETERVLGIAKEFLSDDGIVVAFQKNAWEGLRSEEDPMYRQDLAKRGKLKGHLRENEGIPLYGIPPTRYMGPCRDVLAKVLELF